MTKRTAALLGLSALMLVVMAVGLALSHPGLPTRDRGQLAQAVENTHANHGSPADRFDNTNGGHSAVVTADSVTWWNQSGQEFITPTDSALSTLQLFDSNGITNYTEDTGPSTTALIGTLVPALATVVLVLFLIRFLRKGMPGTGLKTTNARLTGERTGITFADVAGCAEASGELEEVVSVLKHPERYARLGARTPRGVILAGPPGTGKTLLAKAVAGEADVPFFAVSGSEFVEMFVGVGASRVRDLFRQARETAPAIVFIDEIDALGKRRSAVAGHGNEEREQTLNQLLVELDGISSTAPIVVIAATNRVDVLDQALLRPGRFDRHVSVDLPDRIGRRQILEVHARHKPLAKAVDLGVIASQTPGFSGADLANVINEGCLLAARRNADEVTVADLESACLRVMAGPERQNSLLSPQEREIVAYHEMGHALVGHVLPHADPVHKVSIVSRGRALGFTMQLPDRDPVLMARNQLTDKLAGLLGGRAAEYLVFGPDAITTGAADDLEKASAVALRMVTEFGMSPLGLRAYKNADLGEPRPWAEDTAKAIDAEVDRLLDEAWSRAQQVLAERRDLLEELAHRLLDVEVIEADELSQIIDRYPRRAVPGTTVISLPVDRIGGRRAPATVTVAPVHPPATVAGGRGRLLRRTTMAFLRLGGRPAPN